MGGFARPWAPARRSGSCAALELPPVEKEDPIHRCSQGLRRARRMGKEGIPVADASFARATTVAVCRCWRRGQKLPYIVVG